MVFKNKIKQLKCFRSQYSSHLLNASNVSLLGNGGWTIRMILKWTDELKLNGKDTPLLENTPTVYHHSPNSARFHWGILHKNPRMRALSNGINRTSLGCTDPRAGTKKIKGGKKKNNSFMINGYWLSWVGTDRKIFGPHVMTWSQMCFRMAFSLSRKTQCWAYEPRFHKKTPSLVE